MLVTDLGHGLPSQRSTHGQPSADSGGQRKLIPGYAQEHLSLGLINHFYWWYKTCHESNAIIHKLTKEVKYLSFSKY